MIGLTFILGAVVGAMLVTLRPRPKPKPLHLRLDVRPEHTAVVQQVLRENGFDSPRVVMSHGAIDWASSPYRLVPDGWREVVHAERVQP